MSKFTTRMKEKFSLKPKDAAEPRAKEAISKEYSELIGKVGQVQYLVYVYTKETEQLNARLLELNQEANRRDILDAKDKTKETVGTTDAQA